jgi:LysR family transcriptional regulator, glycine cleavage system transcriptional activator
MPTPSLKFLRTFHLAGTLLSFKAAADQLCLTASAVSHQIKTLEDQLGVMLFDRGANSLSLTEAGAQYLHDLEATFLHIESATEQLRRRFSRNIVRLQVPPFFSSELLVPRLRHFSARHPGIDLQISAKHAPQEGHTDNADVSIVVTEQQPVDTLHAVQLFPQTFVPAAAPTLLKQRKLHHAKDVLQHTLIAYGNRTHLWDQWASAQGLAALAPKQIIHFDSMTAAVDAAENGVGIVLVSAHLAVQRFNTGALLKVLDAELSTGESYFLLARPHDYAHSAVRTLMQWLMQEFGDSQPNTSLG